MVDERVSGEYNAVNANSKQGQRRWSLAGQRRCLDLLVKKAMSQLIPLCLIRASAVAIEITTDEILQQQFSGGLKPT